MGPKGPAAPPHLTVLTLIFVNDFLVFFGGVVCCVFLECFSALFFVFFVCFVGFCLFLSFCFENTVSLQF